ncbi:MAG: RNA methyltransferase [Bacteroidota bacterium]
MIARVEHITSLEMPELEPYRTLKRPLEHLRKGIFVAEGEKVVSRLLASNIRIFSLLITPQWFEQYRATIEQHTDVLDIYIGEKKLLDTIVGYELHQAMMAIAKVPKRKTVNELASMLTEKEHFTGVVLDGIVNAENMGVILRNCACLGVDAVMVLPSSCDPYLRRSVRNSMGNIFQLNIVDMLNPLHDVDLLKKMGTTFYAAHPNKKSHDIRYVHFAERSCVVLGAEGHGISPAILNLCDEYVTIPMKEGVDSLNVASASAVILWELQRGARI